MELRLPCGGGPGAQVRGGARPSSIGGKATGVAGGAAELHGSRASLRLKRHGYSTCSLAAGGTTAQQNQANCLFCQNCAGGNQPPARAPVGAGQRGRGGTRLCVMARRPLPPCAPPQARGGAHGRKSGQGEHAPNNVEWRERTLSTLTWTSGPLLSLPRQHAHVASWLRVAGAAGPWRRPWRAMSSGPPRESFGRSSAEHGSQRGARGAPGRGARGPRGQGGRAGGGEGCVSPARPP